MLLLTNASTVVSWFDINKSPKKLRTRNDAFFCVSDKLAVPAVPKMCEGRIYGLESVPLNTCHTVRTLVGSLESLESDVSRSKDQSCHLSESKSLAPLCDSYLL